MTCPSSLAIRTGGSLAIAAALAAVALAATAETPSRSDRLETHRAACLLTRPNANVDACVEEALAAREAVREGELDDGNSPYRRNALLRCRSLPAADQPACEARVRGSGSVSGSVEEGGILRELVVREAPPARPAAAPAVPGDAVRDGLSDTMPADPASPHGPQLPR